MASASLRAETVTTASREDGWRRLPRDHLSGRAGEETRDLSAHVVEGCVADVIPVAAGSVGVLRGGQDQESPGR